MSQIKIYGLRTRLKDIKSKLSDVIHACVVESLNFPKTNEHIALLILKKKILLS